MIGVDCEETGYCVRVRFGWEETMSTDSRAEDGKRMAENAGEVVGGKARKEILKRAFPAGPFSSLKSATIV